METTTKVGSLLATLAIVSLFVTGCGTPATHPNQINSFDGQTYDTLTATHGALLALRTKVSASYPQYADEFNTVATSYNTVLSTYAIYRSSPSGDQTTIAIQIGSLTTNLVALENAIQKDMKVPPAQVSAVRSKALRVRKHFYSKGAVGISFMDVMTELEIAASIAQAIPGASPYAALAELVIQATAQAVNAIEANSGKPIDLTTIPAVSLIPAKG